LSGWGLGFRVEGFTSIWLVTFHEKRAKLAERGESVAAIEAW